jgi:uroporphyrinogen-III synthase
MKVIVTRPRPEVDAWVKQLQDLHFDAVALPLIHIGPVSDTENSEKIAESWRNLHLYHAVMFVSSNAVRYFYPSNSMPASEIYAYEAIKKIANSTAKPRMWATGPGTRGALLAQSVHATRIDSPGADAVQFDSEALWLQVQNQVKPGDKVLIVRGSSVEAAMSGRSWLADRLTAAGVQVDVVVSYQRSAPVFDAAELALMARASTDKSVWLFSSSEAVANLQTISLARSQAGHAKIEWSKARAIATHPRIAQAAKDAGFGVVYESRPLLADVAVSIESVP